jgi:hypothetical protein
LVVAKVPAFPARGESGPLMARRRRRSQSQHMAHNLHPLLESGILLTAVATVVLNIFFNGTKGDASDAIAAAKTAEAH